MDETRSTDRLTASYAVPMHDRDVGDNEDRTLGFRFRVRLSHKSAAARPHVRRELK